MGQHLDETLLSIAKSVGVMHPERIRVFDVARLPLPEDHELQITAVKTGLLGPDMVGLTLGYGILSVKGTTELEYYLTSFGTFVNMSS